MEDKSINKQYHLIKILYFIRFLGDSFFYSFYQVYLANCAGLDEGKIGIICALTPFLALALNPFWNFFGKNVNRNRNILKIMTIIEALAIIFYARVTGFTLIVILTCTLAAVDQPFYSYLDGFSGTFAEQHNKKYARIRMMGTLSYVFGVFLGGILIDLTNYEVIFLIAGIIFLLVSVLLFFVKPIQINKEEAKSRNFKAVLTNKIFYLYIIFYVLTVTVSSIGDSFFSVYLTKERGLSTSEYGYIHSGAILIEFFTMLFISTKGSKIKDIYLFVIAGAAYTIRLLGIGLNLPIGALIPVALVRGIGWGTILALNVKYLIKILGIENLTTGIMIISFITSIVSTVGNIACGALINNLGYTIVFIFLAIITASATTIFACVNFYRKKKNSLDLEACQK